MIYISDVFRLSLATWIIKAMNVAATKKEFDRRMDGTSEGAIQEARIVLYHWR
jgi:hypothetical protein